MILGVIYILIHLIEFFLFPRSLLYIGDWNAMHLTHSICDNVLLTGGFLQREAASVNFQLAELLLFVEERSPIGALLIVIEPTRLVIEMNVME